MQNRGVRFLKIMIPTAILAFFFVYFVLFEGDRVYFWRALRYPRSAPIVRTSFYTPSEPLLGDQRHPEDLPSPPAPIIQLLENLFSPGLQEVPSAVLVEVPGRWKWKKSTLPGSETNAMSMTKSVTALAVGAAMDEGKIPSLDARVSEKVGELKAFPSEMTIRNLLEMTSGLDVDENQNNMFSDLAKLHLMSDIFGLVSRFRESAHKPGEFYHYSNADSELLGIFLQRSTGKRYSDYISEKIWSKIGATNAAVWLDREGGMAKTYCCLVSVPENWLRVGELFLNDGKNFLGEQVVSKNWISQMIIPSEKKKDFGKSIWVYSSPLKYVALHGLREQRTIVVPPVLSDKGKKPGFILVRVGEKPRNLWTEQYEQNVLGLIVGAL